MAAPLSVGPATGVFGPWIDGRGFSDDVDPHAESSPSPPPGIASARQNHTIQWHLCFAQHRLHLEAWESTRDRVGAMSLPALCGIGKVLYCRVAPSVRLSQLLEFRAVG